MATNETVMVIGSNSFSGSHFVNHLLDLEMDVIGVSRSNEPDPVFLPYKQNQNLSCFKFLSLDLNYHMDDIKDSIRETKPAYVVNFAAQGMVAQSWENPEHWFKTNTLANVNLHHFLNTCTFLKKYVQISTPEVYGSCGGNVKESTVYNPSTPYAVSKAAADMSLMAYYKTHNFPVVFIRSANVYGPGQQLYRIVPRAALFFLLDRVIELHGGGESIRSFIHIEDVCKGTFKAMVNAESGQMFHLATSEAITIKFLVKRIAQITGRTFSKHVRSVGDRPGKDKAYLLDCTKAGTELDWKSEISLDKGLQETVEWVDQHIDILRHQAFDYRHKP